MVLGTAGMIMFTSSAPVGGSLGRLVVYIDTIIFCGFGWEVTPCVTIVYAVFIFKLFSIFTL